MLPVRVRCLHVIIPTFQKKLEGILTLVLTVMFLFPGLTCFLIPVTAALQASSAESLILIAAQERLDLLLFDTEQGSVQSTPSDELYSKLSPESSDVTGQESRVVRSPSGLKGT